MIQIKSKEKCENIMTIDKLYCIFQVSYVQSATDDTTMKRIFPRKSFLPQLLPKIPIIDNVTYFEKKQLKFIGFIGRGTYGQVSLYEHGHVKCVLKENIHDNEVCQKLFFKEVRLLSSVNHENVTQFIGIAKDDTEQQYGMLMEYLSFTFSYYFDAPCPPPASSLKDLMKILNKVRFEDFEHIPVFVARDVACGLEYLHNLGIVHRDLKPDNILVSNAHLEDLDEVNLSEVHITKPIVAKLTDFGEARTELIQTATVFTTHRRTLNVKRGTSPYMAPEILTHDGASPLGQDELKLADVWSLSMNFFMLLNPDLQFPYFYEYENAKNDAKNIHKEAIEFFMQILSRECLPMNSPCYSQMRTSKWSILQDVYLQGAKFNPYERQSLKKLLQCLELSITSHCQR